MAALSHYRLFVCVSLFLGQEAGQEPGLGWWGGEEARDPGSPICSATNWVEILLILSFLL